MRVPVLHLTCADTGFFVSVTGRGGRGGVEGPGPFYRKSSNNNFFRQHFPFSGGREGGGGVVQMLLSKETYGTCDFPGGEGSPDPYPLSGSAHGGCTIILYGFTRHIRTGYIHSDISKASPKDYFRDVFRVHFFFRRTASL